MKEYEIVINGMTTTLLLSDEAAAARGLTPAKKAAAPKPEPEPEAKAKTPANKSRTAANKRAEVLDQAFVKKP